MSRLLLAGILALGVHLLLLMTFLPRERIVPPKGKGAGQITVSIVRPPSPAMEMTREPVARSDRVEPVEVDAPRKQEAGPIPRSAPAPSAPRLEPVAARRAVPVGKKSGGGRKEKAVSRTIPLPTVAKQVGEAGGKTPASTEATMVSEVESLRGPEALAALNRPPTYPVLARKRGWEGTVLLEVAVQSDGRVQSVQIKESSSYEMLDKEAVKAVGKWRFSPGTRDGRPEPMKVLVPVHFLLREN